MVCCRKKLTRTFARKRHRKERRHRGRRPRLSSTNQHTSKPETVHANRLGDRMACTIRTRSEPVNVSRNICIFEILMGYRTAREGERERDNVERRIERSGEQRETRKHTSRNARIVEIYSDSFAG